MKHLKHKYNILGLFIDATENDVDPDNVGNIFKLNPNKENLTDNS